MTTTTSNPKNNYLLYIILGVVALAIIVVYIRGCNKRAETQLEQTNFINSMSDTLKTIRLRDSSEKATISVLSTSNTDAFTNLIIQDSMIKALQLQVGVYKNKLKAGSSITIGETNTVIRDTIKTNVTYTKHDSLYPTYTSSRENKWVAYTITMNKDTSEFSLSVTNKYAVILGYDKKKPFVDVINYNPYSSTKILRSYQVSVPKQKVWGIGISSGMCISTGFKVQPYIGVGINYNLIRF